MPTKTVARHRRRAAEAELLSEMAKSWASLKHKIDALAIDLSITGKKLRRLMRRHRKDSIEAGRELIQLIIQHQKRPGKGDIVGFFGENRGEAFWKGLPDRITEYLTFVRPDPDRAGQRR